jgi:predicted RNA binding protein YcfA (HicA-like mRNA interferase family)
MPIKVRELIRIIEKDGWYLARTTGGHRHYHHPSKPGTVTVPGNLGKDVPEGTRKSVMKQAGLE